MKILIPIVLLFATVSGLGQTTGFATPSYSKGGKLIALTDIEGLSDCPTKNLTGRVKKVKVRDNIVTFRLGARGGPMVQLDLNRLADSEKRVILLDMIRARYYVRVAAYACDADAPLSPFSIYRENDPTR